MLKNSLSSKNMVKFFQSGMYIDFVVKKSVEKVVRNLLVYSMQFFAEKFLIEYLTKIVFVNALLLLNVPTNADYITYKWFFIQLIVITLYTLVTINIFMYFI